MTAQEILNRSKELQGELVSHRRYFHQNAEIHTDLPLTTQYVMEKLTQMGYEPKKCGDGGVVALAGGKKPGKVFLIRGDMDALPIREEVECDFKSTNGYMHACGHDLHTAMMLGAAKLLKENENEIEGTVKLMFQAAEETLKGAKLMIENGLLSNPTVDAGAMIHVLSGAPIPTGAVLLPASGIGSSASDWFEIHVQGKGGHGASPESAVDPINVACHIHSAIQTINSRELSASEAAVFTICKFESGTTSNVIPDTAHMYGTIRTFNPEIRSFIPQRMEEIAVNTAKALRAEATFKRIDGCPSIVNDKAIIDCALPILQELLGPLAIDIAKAMPGNRMTGSEDFGYVSEKIPTMMLGLVAGSAQEGYTYPGHHPKTSFNEDALSNGSATYAYLAMKWLEKNK